MRRASLTLAAAPGPIDHLEDARGETGADDELLNGIHCQGNLFRRLEDDGVPHNEGDRERPHWHHEREVEGNYRGDDSECSARVSAVNPTRDHEALPLRNLREGAGILNRLVALGNISEGLSLVLPVLQDDYVREPVAILANEGVELEHYSSASLHGEGRPSRESLLGRRHGRRNVFGVGVSNLADHLGER